MALFGRKINNAENQLAFIEMLRRIVDGQISPEEAVRAYHGILQVLKLKPYRSLEEDLRLTTGVMSYGGTTQVQVPASSAGSSSARPQAAPRPAIAATSSTSTAPAARPGTKPRPEAPDFGKMTPAERADYFRSRLQRL